MWFLSSLKKLPKSVFILLTWMVGISAYFWGASRYPALNQKGMMGGQTVLSDLNFHPAFSILETDPFFYKILLGTANWLETNIQGMSFGFLIAAGFMTLLPFFSFERSKTGWHNTLRGLLIGTPLGVCVNCATPIAKSLFTKDISMALVAMFSSPTLNIVVLSMIFTLFPFYIAILKLAFVLFFILLVVPFLAKNYREKEKHDALQPAQDLCALAPHFQGWLESIGWCAKQYTKNLIRILIAVGPAMILAGFIGVTVLHALPMDSYSADQTVGILLAHVLLIAIIGTLIPTPMTFDVIFSAILLQSGVPLIYVMPLFFTAGIFSLYPFMIIGRFVSFRLALNLMGIVILLGLCFAVLIHTIDRHHEATAWQMLLKMETVEDKTANRTLDTPQGSYPSQIFSPVTPIDDIPDYLKISGFAFQSDQGIKSEQPLSLFQKIDGPEMGVKLEYGFKSLFINSLNTASPNTRGVASGDINQDSYPDLLIVTDPEFKNNIRLYKNSGGKSFIRQPFDLFKIIKQPVILASFIDINHDGWPDIFLSTLDGGNYFIYNEEGDFGANNIAKISNQIPGMTSAVSFGDIDHDGDLDMFWGQYNFSPFTITNPHSQNYIARNIEGDFKLEPLTTGLVTGDTLSSLFYDFDEDGYLDILIGNDHSGYRFDGANPLGGSDILLRGTALLETTAFESKKSLIEKSTGFTMSIAQGDIDNDLTPEIYIAQIADITDIEHFEENTIENKNLCRPYLNNPKSLARCQEVVSYYDILENRYYTEPFKCGTIKNKQVQKFCLAGRWMVDCNALEKLTEKNILEKNVHLECLKKKNDTLYFEGIMADKKLKAQLKHDEKKYLIPSSQYHTNVLLQKDRDRPYWKDIAKNRSISKGGWAWNAKFSDLDNDEWQDLFIVNGMVGASPRKHTNLFYQNDGTGSFVNETKASGLTDYFDTAVYTYLDYNLDGAMDIITVPIFDDVRIYKNTNKNKAINISLVDLTSKNRDAIGGKIIISYLDTAGKTEKKQMRIIDPAGGYKSFDIPAAHFGLKDITEITSIEITWPDGKIDKIKGKIPAQFYYRITRK